MFDSKGKFLRSWSPRNFSPSVLTKDYGGQANNPCGLALDSVGNWFVCAQVLSGVQVFAADGTFVTSFGQFGYSAEEVAGLIKCPTDVCVDSDNRILVVADTQQSRCVQVFGFIGV